MMVVVTVAEEPWDAPASADLRAELTAELDERYDGVDTPERTEPIVVFVVARAADGTPVGCGGLQRSGPAETEVVELYVAPEARGTGTARIILRALENRARDAGLTLVGLTLGTRQPDAMRFLERHGYRRVPTMNSEQVRYTRAVADG